MLTLTSTFLPFPTLTATEEHPDGTVSVIADSVAVPVNIPRFEPGTHRFILDFALKEPNVYVYGKLGFEVGLDEPDLKYRGPVFIFLDELVHFTENVVELIVSAVPVLGH